MEPARNAPRWLKLLVGFHVLAITVWSLPPSSPGVKRGLVEPTRSEWLLYYNDVYLRYSPIRQYVLTLGFFQSWDMFAPNPTNRDIWCDAVVRYQDGSERTYQYPRVFEANYFEKYRIERYRKYYERVNLDDFAFLWPDFAQRVATIMDDQANPPVLVTLRRHFIVTPRTVPFGEYSSNLWGAIREGHVTSDVLSPPNPPPIPFTEAVFYIHEVDQDRLAKARSR